MKLIINIPDEAYELLKSKSELDNIAESIIANGTPISTEGDLISRPELKKAIIKRLGIKSEEFLLASERTIYDEIDNAPTVDLWQMRQEATENALKKAEVLYGRPQGEYETACNVLLSLEQIVRRSDGWEDSAVEAVHNAIQTAIKCMHERPHIIDNCDMNVFEPEKYMKGGEEE